MRMELLAFFDVSLETAKFRGKEQQSKKEHQRRWRNKDSAAPHAGLSTGNREGVKQITSLLVWRPERGDPQEKR
jgi:hypothetical protein